MLKEQPNQKEGSAMGWA